MSSEKTTNQHEKPCLTKQEIEKLKKTKANKLNQTIRK